MNNNNYIETAETSPRIIILRRVATKNLVFLFKMNLQILRGVYPAESGAQNDN
jgi:hypothetical protein